MCEVSRPLVLCGCFVDRCLSFCTFAWPLCCLFFVDIRILITPLVSPNSSWIIQDVTIFYKMYFVLLKLLNSSLLIWEMSEFFDFLLFFIRNVHFPVSKSAQSPNKWYINFIKSQLLNNNIEISFHDKTNHFE
jgi:hypothetical protein